MEKRKLYILAMLIIVPFCVFAQKDSTKKKENIELDPVVISGSKFLERKKNIAQKIDIISPKELETLNSATSADILSQSGKVFVQKSQQGGGSPVIRGFEANRVLLMVDGIRLNNAIYRSGHLQNVIAVDQNMLDRIEILHGPASTLYGSDALGGVVMLKTKDPILSPLSNSLKLTSANALTRYATANNEKTISAGVGFGSRKWGTLTNISFSDFGDLRQGAWDPNNQLAVWGRYFYVERINGQDSALVNNDPLIQRQSGYRQINLLQKIAFVPSDNSKHTLNLQYSTSSDIPRYDRLSETSNGKPKHAAWFYGPQERSLIAYQYEYFGNKKLLDDFNINASYQGVEESRNTRRFGQNELQKRTENIDVLALNLAARKKIAKHEITYGADAQLNFLNSTAIAENIVNGTTKLIDTRYPDGDNNMNLFGAYAQHLYKFGNGKFVLNEGVRFNATRLRSTLVNNFLNLPFNNLNQNNEAVTGNIGLIYMPTNRLRMNINGSRGFRSPNIDDMGKVFESFAGEMLIVPNENLSPEYTNSLDLGLQYQDEQYLFNVYGFYTYFQNAIVLDAFEFDGKDAVVYNGQLTKVFANQNKAQAYLYGAGFETKVQLHKNLLFAGNIVYTYGRFTSDDGSETPLDHIPPLYGRVSLGYEIGKFDIDLFCLFNGAKKLADYNLNGEDNLQFALPTGTPSWYTINLRGTYDINEHFSAQVGIDNMLDRNYRHFASGISASGRNVILSLRFKR